MRKVILCGLAFVMLSLGCTVANAGVIRFTVKGTKSGVTRSVKVTKKAVKVAYKVAY
jgi:hypothetical protein